VVRCRRFGPEARSSDEEGWHRIEVKRGPQGRRPGPATGTGGTGRRSVKGRAARASASTTVGRVVIYVAVRANRGAAYGQVHPAPFLCHFILQV